LDLRIKNKKALIIGAGKGLGLCLSQKLLDEGAWICGVAKSEKGLAELEKRNTYKRILSYAIDLSQIGTEQKLLHFLHNNDFFPDIIVYCMGNSLEIKKITKIADYWRELYRIMFEIQLVINEECLPEMRKRGWGRIVSTGSVAALEAHGPISYCTFKAMLAAYNRSLGRREAANGIIISTVLPGAFHFPGNIWDECAKTNVTRLNKLLQFQKIGRLGRVDELADFMLFLCSEQASFNAGGIYPVDGGLGSAFFQS